VVVTVLEASGSVLDANLLGSKGLFLFHGSCSFVDLCVVDDASSEFQLVFSFNSVIVVSNKFTVHPYRIVFQHTPLFPLIYLAGNSFVNLGSSLSVIAIDGTGSTLSSCGNVNDVLTISILELGGIVPSLSGTVVKSLSGGIAVFSDLTIFKEAGTHFFVVVQSTSTLPRAGMDFFTANYACCSSFSQQFSVRPHSFSITNMPTTLRYPDDNVFVATSVTVSLLDGSGAVLVNAGQYSHFVFIALALLKSP
jgi:hypothetical protein